MTTPDDDCLFCRIVAGQVPADMVAETEASIAFRDVNPQAPTHILVIPRRHLPNVVSVASTDGELLADLFTLAGTVAEQEGIAESGYRLVANTNAGAGQTVFHAHLHVLGGRSLSWPPG